MNSNDFEAVCDLESKAIAYYVNEAKESLARGDWREALRNLTAVKACEDGALAIGYGVNRI